MSLELSLAKSSFLDFMRWVAALLVVIGHVELYGRMLCGEAYAGVSDAYTYLASHSHAVVIVFFVLSGYLVAYSVDNKQRKVEYGFGEYFLDRWSRIYSVLIAAILFTLVIDYIGQQLSQDYLNPAYVPQDNLWLRFFANLLSIQGVQGFRIQLGTDPALWSIGYEFTYYILFGLYSFRKKIFRGNDRFCASAIFLVLIFIGIKMSGYFAIWLMGVCSFEVSKKYRWVMSGFVLAILLFGLLLLNHFLGYAHVLESEYIQDLLLAVYLGMILVFDLSSKVSEVSAAANKSMADFSYSLYAFHMPIIFFYYAVIVKNFDLTVVQWQTGVFLTGFCLFCARILYCFTEAQRWKFRRVGDTLIRKIRINNS